MNRETYRLEDLCTSKGSYGIGAPAVAYDANKYTYLRITDINDDGTLNRNGLMSVEDERAGDYLLKENDIVFARTGNSTGRTYFYDGRDGELVYAGFLIKFSLDNKKVNPRILKYYTHSQPYYDWVRSFDTGGTRGNINAKVFGAMPITLPPRYQQDRIVEILKSFDDKIELNRRINANLEAQAQALFRSWFVDFEPFRDGPFVDSELGKIPQGWKVGTINEIIQILSGYAFKSDTFTEAGPYRLITIKNVQDGSLNIDGAAYLSEIPDKMPQHCYLAIGDILLSLTGNVGRVCIVDRDGLLLNQRVAKLQPKDKRNIFFTYALFRQDSFKQYLIQIAKGTAQLNLSPVETSDTKIVLPNQDILLQFGGIGQPLFDNIVSNCKEIITLSALRDTLLPKLVAGEIDLENI